MVLVKLQLMGKNHLMIITIEVVGVLTIDVEAEDHHVVHRGDHMIVMVTMTMIMVVVVVTVEGDTDDMMVMGVEKILRINRMVMCLGGVLVVEL